MKKINLLNKLLFLFVITLVMKRVTAQTGLNFQGVARSSTNAVLASQAITIKLTILQGSASGTSEYSETRKVTTNAQGLFTAVIGDVGALSTVGNFTTINWKLTPKFLKIEMDPAAGTNFISMGTTQFQSVAYAQFANSVAAENVVGILPVSSGGTGVGSLVAIKTSLAIDKVNNTADVDKPLSTATQTALALKANTTDVTTSLATKVDKVSGKDLSTNDYTTTEKNKLAAITGTNTGDQDLSLYATAASVSLKVNTTDITASLANKVDKVSGKSLTTNDYTTLEKNKLADITGTNTGDQDLSLYATASSVSLKVNSADVTTALNLKENLINKTLDVSIDGTSDVKYPSAKAVKTYVEAVITGGGANSLSFTTPLSKSGNTVSILQAGGSANGYLSSSDWTSFNNKIDDSQKAANNGVATLGNDGKIPSNQIPAISFQSSYVVSSQSAMLALSNTVVGSIAIRSDNNNNYVLSALPATTLSNWIQLATPTSVTSVNSYAGPNVVLTTNDVTEGSTNKYYTNTKSRSALSATAPLVFNNGTGAFSISQAATTTDGFLSATDWNTFKNKQNTLTSGVDYLAPNGSAANLTSFPTFNQNTTGNAATATKLAAPKNINGVAFDGSTDIAIPAKFTNNVKINLSGSKSLGKYANGDSIPARGKTLDEFLLDLVTESIHPTYNAPSVSISSNKSASYEIGTTIGSVILSSSYNQRNGGSAISTTYYKNGGTLGAGVNTDTYGSLLTNLTYSVTVTYGAGTIVLNDNLGNPDATGQIGAGSTSSSLSISPFAYKYLGSSTSNSINDAILLAGTKEVASGKAKSNFNVSITGGTKYIFYAYPASLGAISSISVEGFGSLDAFTLITRNVTNASGHTQSYNIYISNNSFASDVNNIIIN